MYTYSSPPSFFFFAFQLENEQYGQEGLVDMRVGGETTVPGLPPFVIIIMLFSPLVLSGTVRDSFFSFQISQQ